MMKKLVEKKLAEQFVDSIGMRKQINLGSMDLRTEVETMVDMTIAQRASDNGDMKSSHRKGLHNVLDKVGDRKRMSQGDIVVTQVLSSGLQDVIKDPIHIKVDGASREIIVTGIIIAAKIVKQRMVTWLKITGNTSDRLPR